MKPQALQDAIRAAALKKKKNEWKEPVVKQVKITAEDMKSHQNFPGGNRGGMFMLPAAPIDGVLRKELDQLKKQMLDLKETVPHPSQPSTATDVITSPLAKEVEVLRDEVAELRGVVKELASLPKEISRLRETVKSLENQRCEASTSGSSGANVHIEEFEELKQDVESLRAALRKQKGQLVRELDQALSKLEQQQSTIQEQQRQIDALKREVKAANLKADQAGREAKKAKAEIESAAKVQTCLSPTVSIQRTVETSETPRSVNKWDTNDFEAHGSPTLNQSRPQDRQPPTAIQESTTTTKVVSIDDSSSSDSESEQENPVRESSARPQPNAQSNVPASPATPMKKNGRKDSDTRNDVPSHHYRVQSGPSAAPVSPPNCEGGYDCDSDDSPVNYPSLKSRVETRVLRKLGENENEGDEEDGDVEIDVDEPELPTAADGGGGGFARRGSMDSVQTLDTLDSRPRKKTISLLPHKSGDIYEEQRKDSILRKLMMKGKTCNMSVKKVHGKSLVFFSDRIYIPASLRQKTLEYYYKKYRKQTPIIHLEKNCFWADMKNDYKYFEAEKKGTLRREYTVKLAVL